jgi:tetratricopeptide (TPR) repeat protein
LVAYAPSITSSYDPRREPLKDHVDERSGQLGLGRAIGVAVVLGTEQPEEDRQADRPPAQARKLDHEHDDNPAVAPARAAPGSLGLGAVVEVVRAPHAPAGAPEQRVLDGEPDRRAGLDEDGHQEVQQPQPELVGLPACSGEEVVRAAVMPAARQSGGLQHPGDGAVADPPDEPDQQHAERLKRRLRKAWPKQGQQPGKRRGHVGDSRCRAAGTSTASRGQIGLTPTGFGVPRPLLVPRARTLPPATSASAFGLAASLRRVADLQAIDRELDAARRRDDNHARVRLITRAIELPEAQPHRAEYLDELAYAHQQLGRFDDALDAMRQALAAGWDGELDDHPSAQALIADLLLHAGHTEQADDAWRQAQHEHPNDPRLHQVAGCAYADVGLHAKALPWQTKGLELALAAGDDDDDDMIWMLTGERAETLDALGRLPDDLQLHAEELVERQEQEEQARAEAFHRDRHTTRPVPPHRTSIGLAWFPAQEYVRALQTWPSFAEDYQHGPYAAYCARLELLLRNLKTQGVARLALTPLDIDSYLTWCTAHDRDPEQSDSRASYATELLERGNAHPWPPERNEPCWCASGRKYKKCCLRAA